MSHSQVGKKRLHYVTNNGNARLNLSGQFQIDTLSSWLNQRGKKS